MANSGRSDWSSKDLAALREHIESKMRSHKAVLITKCGCTRDMEGYGEDRPYPLGRVWEVPILYSPYPLDYIAAESRKFECIPPVISEDHWGVVVWEYREK